MSATGSNGTPETKDVWGKWFPRMVQVGGFVLVWFEAIVEQADRPYLIAAGLSMMFGGRGIEKMVQRFGAGS